MSRVRARCLALTTGWMVVPFIEIRDEGERLVLREDFSFRLVNFVMPWDIEVTTSRPLLDIYVCISEIYRLKP